MLIDKSLDKYGNRSWKVTTAPTTEPVTADEVKTFGRIDGDDEDTMIEGMIKAVREATEGYLGRSLITQTITLKMDFWPSNVIKLPRPPLISITGIYTVDEDDADTEYDSDNYYIDSNMEPGRLIIKQGISNPTNTDRDFGGFKIVYTAGYGDDASDVPEVIRQGIMIWVVDFYENRVINPNDPPQYVKTLLDTYYIDRI